MGPDMNVCKCLMSQEVLTKDQSFLTNLRLLLSYCKARLLGPVGCLMIGFMHINCTKSNCNRGDCQCLSKAASETFCLLRHVLQLILADVAPGVAAVKLLTDSRFACSIIDALTPALCALKMPAFGPLLGLHPISSRCSCDSLAAATSQPETLILKLLQPLLE